MNVIDQMNRSVEIPESVQRIVSLVPSQTELLVDLGLGDKIVGVTKFCIHPNGFKNSKTVIGGTKNFHFDKIDSLNPDLIIGNKEENYKEGIEQLAKKYPVWMSDILTIDDALDMIRSIGIITQTSEKANYLWCEINENKNALIELNKPKRNALYFIWKNPYMVAGSTNYINDMMKLNGYINLCNTNQFTRYPELTEKQIIELNPEVVLLSSEPFPFKENHITEIQKLLPNSEVKIVDGELYSWYGSRILKALKVFISSF
ncbi:MAG: ABC transporter substrate-binding protein [Flavobacteriales bacterium]